MAAASTSPSVATLPRPVQPAIPDPPSPRPDGTTAPGGWATPGTAAPQPSGAFVASSVLVESAMVPFGSAPRPASPLRRLRPRGVGEILDGGFEVLRHRPLPIFVMTAIVLLPLVAVPSLLSAGEVGNFLERLDTTASGPDTFGIGSGPNPAVGWLATLGGWIAMALVGLGVATLVTQWLMGVDPSLGELLRSMLRRTPVLVAATLLALPIKGLGLLACGIGVVIPVSLLMVLSAVIASESVGPLAAIRRSWRLSSRRLGAMMSLVVAGVLVTAVVQAILLIIGAIVLAIWQSADWVWVALGAVNVLIQLLITPLVGAWASLAYLDLRVRTEGLDLELESTELFASSGRE
jgi:hypothetical protein